MKTSFGWGRALMSLFLCALVAVVMALALAWMALPLEHATITIDGETVALSGIDGWQVALLGVAAVIAALVGLVIAALAILFAFGTAAFGLVIAVIAVLGSLALVASPLLFVGWLVWLLVRPAARRHAALAA